MKNAQERHTEYNVKCSRNPLKVLNKNHEKFPTTRRLSAFDCILNQQLIFVGAFASLFLDIVRRPNHGIMQSSQLNCIFVWFNSYSIQFILNRLKRSSCLLVHSSGFVSVSACVCVCQNRWKLSFAFVSSLHKFMHFQGIRERKALNCSTELTICQRYKS